VTPAPLPRAGVSSAPLPRAGVSSAPLPRAGETPAPLPRAGETPAPLPRAGETPAPLPRAFYERPVLEVAPELIGCVVVHGATSGIIVETEAYHDSEPACHAYAGLTPRTRTLFGTPGHAYVYRSYGIHALLNAVCEPEGIGAAVLIRALQPLTGVERMRARRHGLPLRELCSGPGKLSQALGIELSENGTDLCGDGAIAIVTATEAAESLTVLASPRVGIAKAVELPWRFSVAGNQHVSRPRPRIDV
jgi:DNA-3-methyladenine glycosylase